jgi:hypothetical protein
MRTQSEQKAYLEGMLAGALRVRIKTEGEFHGDVRKAEEWVNGVVELLIDADHGLGDN